jgi:beta-lactam-binding protein with PASTA domain
VPESSETKASTTAPSGPKTVTMPRLTGENAAIADDKLRQLGFTRIQYGSQDENDTVVLLLSNWTVTKQSTKAGAKISADTLIVLTCTKQQ